MTAASHAVTLPPAAPSRRLQGANLVLTQLAWFAAVLGAAHHRPMEGTACVLAVIGWHLAVVARPGREAALVLLACLLGTAVETLRVLQGDVQYASGQPVAQLAPYWMVALWGLLAVSLNVTMRWLRSKLWLAALLGAAVGPAAFASGVRLGAAQFVDASAALTQLAVAWTVLMPLLVWLSARLDGVRPEGTRHA